MKHFKYYSKADILSLTKMRRFETHLGESVQFIKDTTQLPDALKASSAKYVLIGIPEDIGVNANLGIGGTDTTWLPFLTNFLNLQSNDFLTGEQILLLGHFDFGDIKYLIDNTAYNKEELIDAYRHAVNIIDEQVENLIKWITAAKKIPIIIGGGHNNAYPIIKGVAKGLYKAELIPLAQINVVNLDAHADFKAIEGRHSGNAFRYAEEDGYLGKYAIVALQEQLISQNVLTDIYENPFIDYITYEDIFIHEKKNFIQAVAHATGFTEDTYTGIEIDVDVIEGALSSAAVASGISVLHARQFVNFTATDTKAAYLHIAEGAIQLNDGQRNEYTGKLISYLVADFVKAHQQI
jgi:formiminoglutamase